MVEEKKDLSIVIPLFNEEKSLKELTGEIIKIMQPLNLSYEIIFVDDGSTDSSFFVLKELYRESKSVKVIQFRVNYGKAAALAAGFKEAKGKIVITMDSDLQDSPGEIPKFISKIEEGYDLVSGWRASRKDSLSKIIPSLLYNKVTSFLAGIKIHDFNCGFKAYRKEVIKEIKLYGELHRYLPILAHWQGFSVGEVSVEHRPRKYGHSKYGYGRLLSGFLDLLTVLFTIRYLKKPLHLLGNIGLVIFLSGLAINIHLSILWFHNIKIGDRPLLLLGILLMIIGAQFISLGLLAEMITRSSYKEDIYFVKSKLDKI